MRHQASWIRYGFARLRPLSRPIFWAPSIALLLLILFAWEFFSRPELASYFGISTPDEALSREDQAIGADIDSLPLLMNDIKIAPKSETAALDPAQDSAPSAATPSRLSAPTDTIATPQPVQPQSGQGVFRVFTNALTTQLGLPTTAPLDPTTPAPLPPDRLQEAMSKLAAENRPIVSQTPIEGTIRVDTPAAGTSINRPSQSPNSFSTLVEGAQPIAPGTAPSISAPLPIAAPINSPIPQPAETQPSNFGVIQNPPIVNQQAFTVPRSIPGRSIGGGNINTFSNP